MSGRRRASARRAVPGVQSDYGTGIGLPGLGDRDVSIRGDLREEEEVSALLGASDGVIAQTEAYECCSECVRELNVPATLSCLPKRLYFANPADGSVSFRDGIEGKLAQEGSGQQWTSRPLRVLE